MIFLDEIKHISFECEFKILTKTPKYGLDTPWEIFFLDLADVLCKETKIIWVICALKL